VKFDLEYTNRFMSNVKDGGSSPLWRWGIVRERC